MNSEVALGVGPGLGTFATNLVQHPPKSLTHGRFSQQTSRLGDQGKLHDNAHRSMTVGLSGKRIWRGAALVPEERAAALVQATQLSGQHASRTSAHSHLAVAWSTPGGTRTNQRHSWLCQRRIQWRKVQAMHRKSGWLPEITEAVATWENGPRLAAAELETTGWLPTVDGNVIASSAATCAEGKDSIIDYCWSR